MTKIISTSSYGEKKTAIIRSGMESFEVIINKATGITEVWKAQYKKMELGFEKEVFPKKIAHLKTKDLKSKYSSPKEMIENYMLLGRI